MQELYKLYFNKNEKVVNNYLGFKKDGEMYHNFKYYKLIISSHLISFYFKMA